MLKRLVILGLVLLLAGSAALGWILAEKRNEKRQTIHYQSKYGSEPGKELEQYDEWLRLPPEKRTGLPPALDEQAKIKTKAQLLQEQQARLRADLDKLAGGESDAPALAEFLYGENWQQELNKYKGQEEKKELILNGSIVCMSIGGAVFTGCLLLYTVRLLIRVAARLGKLLTDTRGDRNQAKDKNTTDAEGPCFGGTQIETQDQSPQTQQHSTQPGAGCPDASQIQPSVAEQNQSKKPPKTLSKVSRQDSHKDRVSSDQPATTQTTLRNSTGLLCKDKRYQGKKGDIAVHSEPHSGPRLGGSPERGTIYLSATRAADLSDGQEPDPLNNTLIELTQQVAAIREYASTQQDRVKKLQEGYDWNIIRNFCLRVIRCIDNIENRIRDQAGQNGEAIHLREIRDELLFALESSGIEQFEPEINSDYQGQEKLAEAVKERECCDDPVLTGKIAKIIRPGYHYFIDDETARVVRPAMVMLFA